SFASVPLYRLFCQVTGYGGTPTSKNAAETVAAAADSAAGEIVPVTVRFNADVARDLNWTFAPTERSVRITPGEVKKTLYSARNNGARDVVGQATFNVTPAKVGKYFHKVHCFCFEEQPLRAGADALLDVQYFVDPEMLRDPTTSEVRTITLSYTFHYLEDMPPSAADVAAHDHAAHDHSDHDHTLVKTE
ncbi:MAG: cytochrome c oxidase assembly protein, partial [Alphaproteobacteria bacterium]|nr:cytochrome c oxidase assembly protein [Alphaproteobacteria bacterium]